MAQRRLSKSEIKELNQRLAPFSIELSKKDAVDLVENELGAEYHVNGQVWFILINEELVPHLKLLQERRLLKKVTVDMGAIKFVTNGANVMRPGVTAVEEGIAVGELVAIVDEGHGKALAVGRALFDSQGIREAAEGKVVANLHHISDKRWDN